MKRDMDQIREILLLLEQHKGDPWELNDDRDPAESSNVDTKFAYHVMLLHQGGYIHAIDISTLEGINWQPVHMTWQGHDFLDGIRDPEVWAKTKQGADAVKSWSIDTLKQIGKGLIKKQIEEFTGVKVE